jgi:uncharacterized protein
VSDEKAILVRHRLERAHEALVEAEILLQRGFANTFVSRLYYACFYAVSAALLQRGLSSAKHSGVRSFFHKHLVKPGLISPELGFLYDCLFDCRQKGDYEDLVRFNAEEIAPWLEEATFFVATVATLIAKYKTE